MNKTELSLLTVKDSGGGGTVSLMSLAIPIFLENIGVQLIGIVQSILLAQYHGGVFVAPVNKALSVLSIYTILLSMITTGMSILLSIAIGARRTKDCQGLLGSSIVFYSVCSVLLGVICIVFAEPFLGAYGITPADKSYEIAYWYLIGRTISLAVFQVRTVLSTALRCYGYTGIGFVCTVVSNAVNVVWLLVGIYLLRVQPEQGVQLLLGAGAAADAVGFLTLWIAVKRRRLRFSLSLDRGAVKQILHVGFPASITDIAYTFSVALTTVITAVLSDDLFNLKIYITNITFFGYAFGTAVAFACAILVGRYLGMREIEKLKRMHAMVLRIVLASNLLFAVVTVFLAEPLLVGIYGVDRALMTCVVTLFVMDIAVELGRGFNNVYLQGGLVPVGDTIYTTVISVINCFLTVGVAALCVLALDMGLYGVWVSFIFSEITKAACFVYRWHKGNWQKRALSGAVEQKKG